MPQIFQVLKCYKCLFFQVHQTKRSNKWECKLCGEKQTIKRNFGIGIAKDCRLHVQKLNGIRGEVDETMMSECNDTLNLNGSCDEEDPVNEASNMPDKYQAPAHSKWSELVEKTEELAENETMYLDNMEVVLEVPTKRRKFSHPKAKKNKVMKREMDDFSKSQMGQESDITQNIQLNKSEYLNYPGHNKELLCSQQKELFQESKHFKNAVRLITKTKQGTINTEKENFIPFKVHKTSKWAQFAGESDEENADLEDETHVTNDDPGKHILVDNEEQCDTAYGKPGNNDKKHVSTSYQEKIVKNEHHIQKNFPYNLFSLCDENDLDDVLDI